MTLDATLVVAGAVQEPALQSLDASSALGALTVVRFSDGELHGRDRVSRLSG